MSTSSASGKIATVTADDQGQWLYRPELELQSGDHTVEARASDALNNEARVSVDFTIDTSAPNLTFDAPAQGAALATTLKAKDLFRGHPFDVGIIGSFSHSAGRRLMDEADCIVVFGASLNQRTTSAGAALPAAAQRSRRAPPR